MLKRLLRLIGFALIAFGLYYLVTAPSVTLGEAWSKHHFTSLQILQPAIERYLSVQIWEKGFVPLLLLPAWLPSVILGVILAILGKRRALNVQPLQKNS